MPGIDPERYEPVIRAIVQKYTQDTELRKDCAQEARIALWGIRPTQVSGNLDAYCRNAIRNSVLTYLQSYRTGDWYTGRSDPRANGRRRRPNLSRYVRLDELTSVLQIDRKHRIWLRPGRRGTGFGEYFLSSVAAWDEAE